MLRLYRIAVHGFTVACVLTTGSVYGQDVEITPLHHHESISTRSGQGVDLTWSEFDPLPSFSRAIPRRAPARSGTGSLAAKVVRLVQGRETGVRKEGARKNDSGPASRFDLRQFLPPPGEQDQNDCMAWALAYAFSCQICQERHRSPEHAFDRFSPAFIYNQVQSGGVSVRPLDAIDFVRKNGCASLATMPEGRHAPPRAAFIEAKTFSGARNSRVRTLQEIKAEILDGYPVILVIALDDEFRNPEPDATPYQWSGTQREYNHAVCAVGYDDTLQAILVLNSFGSDWKDAGFCWVSYATMNEINDRHWCAEAHVVKVAEPAPVNVWTAGYRRFFQLKEDKKVYEDGSLVSPETWQIDAVACTRTSLYMLRHDQMVAVMEDGGRGLNRIWVHLDFGEMANRKVAMIAGSPSTPLHALTSDGDLSEHAFGNWRPVSLPAEPGTRFVDLRLADRRREQRATTANGEVFVYRYGTWRLEQ